MEFFCSKISLSLPVVDGKNGLSVSHELIVSFLGLGLFQLTVYLSAK